MVCREEGQGVGRLKTREAYSHTAFVLSKGTMCGWRLEVDN